MQQVRESCVEYAGQCPRHHPAACHGRAPLRERFRRTPSRSRLIILILVMLAEYAPAQMVMSGQVRLPRHPGTDDLVPCMTVLAFGTPHGPGYQSVSARTWETAPAGWFRLSGPSTGYTFAFASPSHYMRPVILTNQFFEDRVELVRNVMPPADYAMLEESGWDGSAAHGYFQTFIARSTSITHVGFKLAHDGIDGDGPGSQDLYVSVHRVRPGPAEGWEQVGPEVPVLFVNAGGVLSIVYSAGWNSGEVPTVPGATYAVRIRPGEDGRPFQCFWRQDIVPDAECYRISDGIARPTGHDMWLYVAGDGDGLLVPFNKRVRREFHDLTRFSRRWSQTYVARGHGVAAVMLYAAVATSQPPMAEQQLTVRLREGGPDGPIVGIEKIAVGQSTATAESGNFVVCFAPGEAPVEPGKTYAIDFEAFGGHEGFNPWMKQPLDPYDGGAAWFDGRERMNYDLDMLIVEYENRHAHWTRAVVPGNLLVNGDMQQGRLDPADDDAGGPDAWTRFAIDPGTSFWYLTDPPESENRIVRVIGGSINGRTVDGGLVQRVDGLSRGHTYRLSGRIRCSFAVDDERQVLVGLDPTGQESDPRADTIRWSVLPRAAGVFEDHLSRPVRPQDDALSVWLRARTTSIHRQPFQADFDDFALHQVAVSPPIPDALVLPSLRGPHAATLSEDHRPCGTRDPVHDGDREPAPGGAGRVDR